MKTLASLLVLLMSTSNASAQSALKVLTLNTNHGGQAPWSVANQVAAIVAEVPDVVFLQEAKASGKAGGYADRRAVEWHGELPSRVHTS